MPKKVNQQRYLIPVLLVMFFFLVFNVNGQNKKGKPNIIFFLVDDMGWQDTSVPFHSDTTELNRFYHTPNMEILANQGLMFTQAYAHSLCSPTRISLMTGMSSARHMVTNWTLRKDISPGDRNDHPSLSPAKWNVNGMSPIPGIENTVYAKTFPMFLQKAGYRTIHVGKAHFGAKDTPGEDPLNLGFDVNIAGHAAGGPGSYLGINNFSAEWRNEDRIWDVPGLEKYHGKDIYLTEALTLEANSEIEKAVREDKPFYLYMAHYAIHGPWEEDIRFARKYQEWEEIENMAFEDKDLPQEERLKRWRKGLSNRGVYASLIEGMDKSLGDIMHNLRRLGIEDNTIIVFMSDNGQPREAPLNLPLRGHKILPYEGGVRVPFIVKWPGVTKARSSCSDYFIVEDLFPTFLEMAGVKDYSQVSGKIDGKSIVPLIKAEKDKYDDHAVFWHYPHVNSSPYFPFSSVRKGDWKLIYRHVERRLELFNIKNDIAEQNNLANEEKEKVIELAKILSDHLRECKAKMTIDKKSKQPVEYPDEILN